MFTIRKVILVAVVVSRSEARPLVSAYTTAATTWKKNSAKFTIASISASQPLGDAGGAIRRFDHRLSQALAEFVAWIRCKRVQVVAFQLPENSRNHSWFSHKVEASRRREGSSTGWGAMCTAPGPRPARRDRT